MKTKSKKTKKRAPAGQAKGVGRNGGLAISGIWTVATLGIHDGGRDVDARTWGYHFTRDEAVAAMHRSCDAEAGYYTHAVIENFDPGLYALSLVEEWFVWDGGWSPCAKPEGERCIVNYGLG